MSKAYSLIGVAHKICCLQLQQLLNQIVYNKKAEMADIVFLHSSGGVAWSTCSAECRLHSHLPIWGTI